MEFKERQLVMTPHGKAKVLIVDNINKSVRVEHLQARCPITDYKFSDLKLVENEIAIGDYMQGNICNSRGDTIDKFIGHVDGFTKTKRIRIKNNEGKIRNFHKDETWNLKTDGTLGRD